MRALLISLFIFALTGCPGKGSDTNETETTDKVSARCSQSFVSSYSEAKSTLAKWSSGSETSDEKADSDCKTLMSEKTDVCQVDCSNLKDASDFCPSKSGNLVSPKDVVDQCQSFQRRAKSKPL